MNLREQKAAALKAAREIAEAAKAVGRNLTEAEVKSIDEHLAKADEVQGQIDQAEESQGRMKRLGMVADAEDSGQYFLGSKADLAGAIVKAMSTAGGGSYGQKALITAGDVFTDVPLSPADPITQPRPPASLLDALPFRTIGQPTFRYLRQTTRTNNAATVAVGGTKPTSAYGLTPVEGKLHVIAHVSEPLDEYWLDDAPSLLSFVQAEMVYGLRLAAEAQVLNGDGVGSNLTGIANTSGIQTQAFATDEFLTTRKAITAVDVLGHTPRMFVMNPTDWENIETAAFTSGNYILNAEGRGNLPVDAAARRLWGVPVVLSTTQAAGAAFLISTGSVEVLTDGSVKTATTNGVSDDFVKNQLRMRVESRFEVAVTNPTGVVSIDLTAV